MKKLVCWNLVPGHVPKFPGLLVEDILGNYRARKVMENFREDKKYSS